jgi:hypothetical protein
VWDGVGAWHGVSGVFRQQISSNDEHESDFDPTWRMAPPKMDGVAWGFDDVDITNVLTWRRCPDLMDGAIWVDDVDVRNMLRWGWEIV